jgi:hypothetical protein
MSCRTWLSSFFLLAVLGAAACGDDGGSGDAIDAAITIDAPGTDAAGDPDAPDPAVWAPPACTSVIGTGAVTFTHDEGATLAPRDQTLSGVRYTMGLVALSTPNALLAVHNQRVLRSDDAGCHWHDIGAAGGNVVLVAAGERAYGYVDNDVTLLRIDGETITPLRNHATGVVGMAADDRNADHLRLVDSDGQVWDSVDAGGTFTPIGRRAAVDAIIYRGAFSPGDLDFVIAGASTVGAQVSHDGGATWTRSLGLSTGNANAMNLAMSPVDPNVVWAQGVDLATDVHTIWRSVDGGAHFAAVLTEAEMSMTNGMPLFAHPTDANLLYATFGTYFQGYGTDIFRYDGSTDTLTLTHNAFHDVIAIAFLPGDPSWMYFGITSEQISGAP